MNKVFGFLSTLFLVLASSSVFAAATSDQYLAAGNTLYQQKDYSRAITYYKAAIQVDPNNAAAHTRLANTYYMLGQKQDALGEYQAALNLNPNNAQLADFVQKLRAQLGGGTASTPASSNASASLPDEKGLFLGAGLGIDNAMNSGVTSSIAVTTMAIGGELQGGYAFDKNFAVRLEIDAFTSSPVSQVSALDLRVLPEVKYTFDGKGFQPYLVGGVGFDMLSFTVTGSTSSVSASGLDFALGGGVQFDLGNKLKAFIELKYNSASVTYSYNTGGSGGSSGGSSSGPAVSLSDVPITAGVLFSL